MKTRYSILLLCLLVLQSFGTALHAQNDEPKFPVVTLKTTAGDLSIYLYRDTPKHRDNFLKLVNENVYDSSRFSKIEKMGVLQGGALKAFKPADSACRVNQNEVGYELTAEHKHDRYFHKKYAVAMAQKDIRYNAEYKTSGNQFYIVMGMPQSDGQLTQAEINAQNLQLQMFGQTDFLQRDDQQWLYSMDWKKIQEEYPDSLRKIGEKLQSQMTTAFEKENKRFKFTEDQKAVYKELGGLPERDYTGTVFGEVVAGSEVADQLALAEVDANSYPKVPIYILDAKIEQLTAKEIKGKYGIETK